MSSISKFISSVNQACKKNSTYAIVEFTKNNLELTQLMYRNGLLSHYSLHSYWSSNNIMMKSIILYLKVGEIYSSIRLLRQISKPGRRIYISSQNSFHRFGKYNFSVLSTSMGFFTINEARQLGIGGELLMEIDC